MDNNGSAINRAWMHTLQLTDRTLAAELYMPFVTNGGLFIETEQPFRLGDSLFVLVTVGTEGKKYPINGKVVWINRDSTRVNRPVGVGIQFGSDEAGQSARVAIEELTGRITTSLNQTATI